MVTKRIKIIFSIISVLLMVPTTCMFNTEASDFSNFYRTLFVFYIDEVIEMFGNEGASVNKIVAIWEIINQWLGAFVCAISFCMLMGDFQKILMEFSFTIHCSMLGIVFSGIICAICNDVVLHYRKKTSQSKIKKQVDDNI